MESFILAHRLSYPPACRILVPQPGIEPESPTLKCGFLTTGPPGKSLQIPYVVITEACPKDLSKDEEIELSW